MQGKGKKGFYPGDEDDHETSSYFAATPSTGSSTLQSGSNLFRSDLLASAGSPSQVSSFNPLFQTPGFPRSFTGNGPPPPFQRQAGSGLSQQQQQHTPMSFAMPPTQQHSPNRNVMSYFHRSAVPVSQPLGSMAGKRGIPTSGIGPAHMGLLSLLGGPTDARRAFALSSAGIGSQSAFNYPHTSRDLTNQPNLDNLSEFPNLSHQRAPSSPLTTGGARNYGSLRDSLSMKQGGGGGGNATSGARDDEFSIRTEDFPALPGAENVTSTSAGASVASNGDTDPQKQMSLPALLSMHSASAEGNQEPSAAKKYNINFAPDGTISNIPPRMITDQFGMVGLLSFVRAMESNTNLVALAPGIELTTLGLNLNASEELYKTFQSPWADSPCRPQDIDYNVPAEYMTNMYIKDKLSPVKLEQYGEDLLFYLFYTSPGDVLQLLVASELYRREWRYHKEEQVWITRAPNNEPEVKTNTYEKGNYFVWDIQSWRKVLKYFHLEYSKLEEKPVLTKYPGNPQ